jgi:hypothetical protein
MSHLLPFALASNFVDSETPETSQEVVHLVDWLVSPLAFPNNQIMPVKAI